MAQGSFVRFLRRYSADKSAILYEGLSSFRAAMDGLQEICGQPGMDLDAQIHSFSGTTTMKDLLEKGASLGQWLDQLLEGKTKFPDDPPDIQIASLADFAFKLDSVTDATKNIRGSQHLSQLTSKVLNFALALEAMSKAYEQGLKEGIRRGGVGARSRR